MKNYLLPLLVLFGFTGSLSAQNRASASQIIATKWVDSVFKTLSPVEQIAQLMVVRLSTYDAKNNTAIFFDEKVDSLARSCAELIK